VETLLKSGEKGKVTDFHNSIGRNSENTMEVNFQPLSRLQKFLGKYGFTPENIVDKLLKNLRLKRCAMTQKK
jgi:hypothetical protein